jgi:hypothetical protein
MGIKTSVNPRAVFPGENNALLMLRGETVPLKMHHPIKSHPIKSARSKCGAGLHTYGRVTYGRVE